MLGNILAGTEESPGHVLVKDGRKVKVVRGMAGIGANVSKATREKNSEDDVFAALVPEGVEGVVPYKGAASVIIRQLTGGLRSGMSYTGARTIEEMKKFAKFVRMTGAGLKESGFHDISKL
jgi:IMP dehydrogenase